jgi:hypothetical protein
MDTDELTRSLREAAAAPALDEAAPLAAIHARMRRLHRRRRFVRGGGVAAAAVLVVAAGLVVAIGRHPSGTVVRTGSISEPPSVGSPTSDPNTPNQVPPSWTDIPPASHPAPSADHYFKAAVVLSPAGHADVAPNAVDLQVVAGFAADEGLIDRVAGEIDRSPTWVSRRITADADQDRRTVTVVAIDTDAETTRALAQAAAHALVDLASHPTAETYAAERQRVQVRLTWLIDQRRQLEARSDQPAAASVTAQISELDDVLHALGGTPRSLPLAITASGGSVEINELGFDDRWNAIAAYAF